MTNPGNVSRQLSMSTIVQAITTYGPISRASVSKMTGLSKQTVSEIVGQLEADGWVGTVGQTEGHVGRRAVVYEVVPDAALVASVDLGGTKVRVALCNLTGAVVAETVAPTVMTGGDAVTDQIASMIHRLTTDHNIDRSKVRSIVVGVPGVPQADGTIAYAPNVPGIETLNFPETLSTKTGVEVVVENDVNLAALGEHWMTKRGDSDDIVYLSIGTGIGAGLVIGGNLVRGSTGAAGEVGYLPFGADPFDPESLRVGALERVSATLALIDYYRDRTGKNLDVPGIFEAALTGDTAAQESLERAAKNIALAIGAITAVIDPSCIVIGGSIGARKELRELIRPALASCFPRSIPIENTLLGNHAALAGATSIALSRLHIALFTGGLKGAEINVPPPELGTFQEGAA
ncbi:ROK family transcriptional regulator [Shimia sagamensis]|uniref:Sugar kinase of the NBD/HSP70 family, may contain an N-terminal HTH domain n=1 Tax=Shimia sagamensis TaxID=1566352 RepID=A0ABY1N7R2_9RHOB|nr:ROK family transcriptional regulator [Shimia sagamensis]SMP02328.1 Sugar kinase of the NBD/HSP70 family, may contain an N-terminal HTH domain [Shimia sagamensis]